MGLLVAQRPHRLPQGSGAALASQQVAVVGLHQLACRLVIDLPEACYHRLRTGYQQRAAHTIDALAEHDQTTPRIAGRQYDQLSAPQVQTGQLKRRDQRTFTAWGAGMCRRNMGAREDQARAQKRVRWVVSWDGFPEHTEVAHHARGSWAGGIFEEEAVGGDVQDAWSFQFQQGLLGGIGPQKELGLRKQAVDGLGFLTCAGQRRPRLVCEF
jgi:hypothetical protein